MRYSKLDETCKGFPIGKLGNQSGGFPFEVNGKIWMGSEYQLFTETHSGRV